MSKIPKLNELIPNNLKSEEEKFFAENCEYNPQFRYNRKFSKKELTIYGKPKFWYLFLAKRIIRKYKKKSEKKTKFKKNDFLNQKQVVTLIKERLNLYNLQDLYQIVLSDKFMSRISINNKNKEIKIRLPIKINKEDVDAVLNHEIDTHALRQVNYEKQPWFAKKKKYGLRSHLITEEGLAIINELLVNQDKFALKSATNYVAVDLALKKDFVTVFNFLNSVFKDKERAWIWTVKKKRGISDTSKPGAYTKDMVYFEGLVKVLNYLKKNNFDPSELYYGKIDHRDLKKVKKISEKNITLPKFLQEKANYKKTVKKIIKENLL